MTAPLDQAVEATKKTLVEWALSATPEQLQRGDWRIVCAGLRQAKERFADAKLGNQSWLDCYIQIAESRGKEPDAELARQQEAAPVGDVEAAAKLIYETWKDIPEYRPWPEDGGNSLKQCEARRVAAQILAASRVPVASVAVKLTNDQWRAVKAGEEAIEQLMKSGDWGSGPSDPPRSYVSTLRDMLTPAPGGAGGSVGAQPVQPAAAPTFGNERQHFICVCPDCIKSTPAQSVPLGGGEVPKGFALVPLRLTQEMDDVIAEEGWQWEDLLAAAGTITTDQYDEIAAQPLQPQDAKDARPDSFHSDSGDRNRVQAPELSGDELALFQRTIEDFADCGETDTDYEILVNWAQRGLLECTNFQHTAAAHRFLDAIKGLT